MILYKSLIVILIVFWFSGIFYGQEKGKLEKLLAIEGDGGDVYLNPKDGSILVNTGGYEGKKQHDYINWIKNGMIIKKIDNAYYGKFSPDGKYYSYNIDKDIYILDDNDQLINKFTLWIKGIDTLNYVWSYDSKFIYSSERHPDMTRDLYRIDINTGKKELIIESKTLSNPVTVKDTNVIYLLTNVGTSLNPNFLIVKYNLKDKIFENLKLPMGHNGAYDDFTVSPDERIFVMNPNLFIYDIKKQKIIEYQILTNQIPRSFSWFSDISYFIFSMNDKEVYKYTLPNEYWITNKGSDIKLSEKLHLDGFALYKQHKDAEAVVKYEEALKYGESAQIYYDYGNSLSNLKDRLEDSLKAYQKAVDLGFDKKHLALYNMACVDSKLGKLKEAYYNLTLAVQARYNSFKQIEKDSDLMNLRADKDWSQYLADIKVGKLDEWVEKTKP